MTFTITLTSNGQSRATGFNMDGNLAEAQYNGNSRYTLRYRFTDQEQSEVMGEAETWQEACAWVCRKLGGF